MKVRIFKVLFFALVLFVMGYNAPIANAGGTFCLDMVDYCSDVKIVHNETASPGTYSLTGYEYGCGAAERILDGSARIRGNTLYLQYTTNATTSYTTPRIGQFNIQLNLASLSGSGQFAYHYESYHNGTANFSFVDCAVASSSAYSTESDPGE